MSARRIGRMLSVLLPGAVAPIETRMEAAGVYAPGRNWEDEANAAAEYLSTKREQPKRKASLHVQVLCGAVAPDCIRWPKSLRTQDSSP